MYQCAARAFPCTTISSPFAKPILLRTNLASIGPAGKNRHISYSYGTRADYTHKEEEPSSKHKHCMARINVPALIDFMPLPAYVRRRLISAGLRNFVYIAAFSSCRKLSVSEQISAPPGATSRARRS